MNVRKILLVLLAVALATGVAQADNKKKKKSNEIVAPYCPVPDPLPELPLPDKPAMAVTELGLQHRERLIATNNCGIDISHYQHSINWQLVSIDRNVQFAYVKCSESTHFIDDYFRQNMREARQYGIPVGVYHFWRPEATGEQQFQHFMQTISGTPMDLIPVLDVEKRGKVSLEHFQREIRVFLELCEKQFGVKPIIYTGQNFYNNYMAGAFTNYKFFIAKYSETVPELVDDVQMVLWQFTSKGQIAGINGHVDRSCFMGSYGLKDILMRK